VVSTDHCNINIEAPGRAFPALARSKRLAQAKGLEITAKYCIAMAFLHNFDKLAARYCPCKKQKGATN